MNNLVTLTNVTDIRTGKFHSVVKIKERLARWFVAEEEEQNG